MEAEEGRARKMRFDPVQDPLLGWRQVVCEPYSIHPLGQYGVPTAATAAKNLEMPERALKRQGLPTFLYPSS